MQGKIIGMGQGGKKKKSTDVYNSPELKDEDEKREE